MKRIGIFFCGLVLALSLHSYVFGVSANVTLGSNGREFECDTTQREATVNVRGGSIYNKSSGSVWVDFDAGTVTTSSGSTSLEVAQGVSIRLPSSCTSFTFKTASGSSYLQFVGP